MRAGRIFCVLAVCAGLAMPAAAEEGVTLAVGDRIALKAEDVPLGQVLVALSEAVPFKLVERGEALEQPVSFDFEAADWAEAFDLLLRGEGYALTTDAAGGEPTMLVVDWDVVGEALAAAPAGDTEARIRAAAKQLFKPRDHAAEAVAAVDKARRALQEARLALAAANGEDPEGDLADAVEEALAAYNSALGNLGNHDDERAVGALVPALDEDDDSSRLSALEALRWQSRTSGNAEAVARVSEAVGSEADPALQRAALEVLVRYGEPDEVLRTIEPLALSEGPNQDLAVREWLRISEEQEARNNPPAEQADLQTLFKGGGGTQ